MAVGRISGPLLKDNLLRDGVNLAFETDLLYLDVINGRVGIKTKTPTNELSVSGTTRTTNLEVTTQADIATFTLSGSTVASSSEIINLLPSGANAVVYQSKISVNGDLQITANTIETTVTNSDLAINTVGNGQVNINTNVLINGDLHATGTITADGSIQLGDATTDNITFNADINSSIIPDLDNFYDLGTDPAVLGGKEWANVYAHNIYSTSITASSITSGGVNLTLPQGNILYVATTGSDSNSGTRENDPFLTVKQALSVATAGTTIYVYPGIYTEIFPLTVPIGVAVKGAGLRAVTLQPTVGTIDLDAFLLNGETTVEDLTVAGFRYNGTNNTGYGFRFATNFLVTTRSPYIRNVTVLTRGSIVSTSDPYGFDANDAGKGALADGSVANASSKEASMLFHSVTFITPNQETITATNGVRIEWLNSFTYFADKGIYAYSSSTGFAGNGQTRLRINNRTGTWSAGDTVNYYDTDGITLLGTGTIDNVTGNYVNLTGRCLGFETVTDRIPTTLYAQGNARLSQSIKKFGNASLALDGTGDYVTHPTAPDFGFGTGDFTIEFWVYRNDVGRTEGFLDFKTTNPQVTPNIYAVGTTLYYFTNGSTRITGTAALPSNSTWYHIALSRVTGNTRLFVDGAQVGSTYTDANNYIATQLVIGNNYIFTAGLSGYMDDLRISKGVGRYATTFAVPTAALTGDLDTVLLLHFNGNNNSTVFLDDGITLQDIRNVTTGGTASIINFADYSDFGAEVRSIGSANIYGNYGVYGDGIGVIVYLVSQNFAYVGSGKLSTNDPNDRIHVNEVVELNNAHIYYTSVNNEGGFDVGNLFTVNQKTGEVTFNGTTTTITTATGVTFTDGVNTTTILPGQIDTGNIRISGNTIESITGDVIVTASSGAINLQNNTFVTGNLDVTGNVTIGGNITIGDATTDTINFVAGIDSNLVPATTAFYDLGTDLLRWANVFLNRAEIDGLIIDNNSISTTIGNDNLILSANGAGIVSIPNNNVELSQDLTVTTGATNLKGTTITGSVDQTGNILQTGDYTQTGDTDITGSLTVSTYGQFEKIRVDGNTISTTATDTDLQLAANGTGKIYIPSNDVLIDQNLTVNGLITTGDLTVTNTLTADALDVGDILIQNNEITTQLTNSNLVLSANGLGIISIPSNNVVIDQALTVNGDTTLKATTINGNITQTGNITQLGDYTQTGDTTITGNLTVSTYGQFEKIRVDGDTISTTVADTDLKLEAAGTGRIYIPSDDVQIDQNLTVNGLVTTDNLTVTNTLTVGAFSTGDILIQNNEITTQLTNSNLVLSANGLGIVSIPSNNVVIDQDLTVVGTTSLKGTTIDGTVTQTGNVTQTGDYTQTGNTDITGNLTVSSYAEFEKVKIDNNVISTYVADTDLRLEAAGVGRVYIPTNNVQIDQNLKVNGQVSANSLLVTTNITAGSFDTGDILIENNSITTKGTTVDLELIAQGTGIISVPTSNVQMDQALVVNGDLIVTTGTTYLKAVNVVGNIDQIGDINQTGNFQTSGTVGVTGNITGGADLILPEITISGNIVTTTTAGTDLDLRANGTGDIIFEQLRITNNNIQATEANANIVLTPLGSGSVVANTNQSVIIPVGTDADRPVSPVNGMIRYNSQRSRYEGWNSAYNVWTKLSGVEDFDGNTRITAELTPGANDNIIRFYANGTITATIDSTKLFVNDFQTTGIDIQNNTISAINASTDINLTTSGTGGVRVGNLNIRNNTITNTASNAVTEFVETGTGYVKISGVRGVVIPVGDQTDRPLNPEVGMMRFNTFYAFIEIWDGSNWINIAGTTTGISIAQASDIGIVSALIYG